MISLLLAIIYLSFISLGLPDGLLGAAWPVMCVEMDVPVSYAGLVAITIAAGTILSSLMSDRLTLRFGTAKVTAVSVAMTALSLLGFSSPRLTTTAVTAAASTRMAKTAHSQSLLLFLVSFFI